MKPICPKCQRFYRPKKNGYYLIECMPVGGERVPPGTERPDLWQPYKLWVGDLWTCDGCGHDLIVGCGHQPVNEHYKPDFKAMVERVESYQGPVPRINDC
jgi:ribosomal protein L37AE/L43A